MFHAERDRGRLALSVRPELASWDRAGSTGQTRLAAFIRHVQQVVGPELARTDGPVSLGLDVALPETVSLLDERDLDNYLFPLMVALDRPRGRIVAVRGTKRHADTSFVVVASARPDTDKRDWQVVRTVLTDASASSVAYKRQIHEQLHGAVALPPGPVVMQLGYLVGRRRYWPNLWKPTIDALEHILGSTRPDQPWHPLDGRIVSLGLHCTIDPARGNAVEIAIRAAPSTA